MTPVEIAVVIIAAATASLVKSTTGMGYPLVLLPVLALFIDVADAVVIVAPSNLVLNLALVWRLRDARHESVTLPPFLGASVVGGLAGAFVLSAIPDTALRLLLVAIIVLFLAHRWRSPQWSLDPHTSRRYAGPVGLLAGLSQGASGVSGPIVSAWFLSQPLAQATFIVSIASAFAFSGLAQIVGLAAQGLFTGELLLLGLLLVPLAWVVMPAGTRLRSRLSVERFELAVVALLVVSALSLLVKIVF